MFRDVEAALDQDPASEAAQALGQRWKALVGAFTGGNPEIAQGLNRLYGDRPNWPAAAQQQMTPFNNPRAWEFMARVLNCKAIG